MFNQFQSPPKFIVVFQQILFWKMKIQVFLDAHILQTVLTQINKSNFTGFGESETGAFQVKHFKLAFNVYGQDFLWKTKFCQNEILLQLQLVQHAISVTMAGGVRTCAIFETWVFSLLTNYGVSLDGKRSCNLSVLLALISFFSPTPLYSKGGISLSLPNLLPSPSPFISFPK